MPNRPFPAHIFKVLLFTSATVAIAVGVAMLLPTLGWSLPNPAWQAQLAQAEKYGDEETLRRLKYIRGAGTLRYPSDARDASGAIASFAGTTYHAPCCGEADSYEADDFSTNPAGELFAILTCNGKDSCEEIPGKMPRKPGTKVKIPADRILVHDPAMPNDTGHGYVWIAPGGQTDSDGNPLVYCYAFPTGG